LIQEVNLKVHQLRDEFQRNQASIFPIRYL